MDRHRSRIASFLAIVGLIAIGLGLAIFLARGEALLRSPTVPPQQHP